MIATRIVFYYGLAMGLISVCFLHCSTSESNTIRIAAAASLHGVLDELIMAFTEETQISCEVIYGSSGKMAAQILEGAPYHVFISADLSYTKAIAQSEKTIHQPKPWIIGSLILWRPSQTVEDTLEFSDLISSDIDHIAIANPKTAPYGKAAMDWLSSQSFFHQVKDKLVFGESIGQTNQFIRSGAADMGFTSLSTVLESDSSELGQWLLIPAVGETLTHSMLLVKTELAHPDEDKVLQWLHSEAAISIVNRYGYMYSSTH